MPNLYQQSLSKRDLYARVSQLSQIGGVRSYTLNEGKAKGVDAFEVRTGGGLSYVVLPDRGLDITWAEYRGIPLGFLSKSGLAGPQYYCPDKSIWGESFTGGLLTTCGLTQAGRSCVYQGRKFSTHGNISNIPAVHSGSFETWDGDDMVLGVRGTLLNGHLYRENLELNRTITSKLGENSIKIQDVITNNGFQKLPLMLIYHMNFGFPFVDQGTTVKLKALSHQIVSEASDDKIGDYRIMESPHPDNADVTYFHDLEPDSDGKVCCTMENPHLHIGISLTWEKQQLWNFAEWKHLLPGDYVVGLEPCNNYILGVLQEEANDTLEYIEPGETRSFALEFCAYEF